jgi:hypothetical protein
VDGGELNLSHNYLIRSCGTLNRQIVHETVDAQGHRLGYEPLIELKYRPPSDNIQIVDLPRDESSGADMAAATEIAKAVVHDFNHWRHALGNYPIRMMLITALKQWHATRVRPSGGVYFLHSSFAGELEKLSRFVDALPGVSALHVLPLVDDRKQREMLRSAYEFENVEAADGLIGDIQEMLRDPKTKVGKDRFFRLQQDYRALTEKAAEYSDLLDEKMEMTAARLEILQESIVLLAGRIR